LALSGGGGGGYTRDRHSVRRMLERSVGECYFVTFLVADAPQASDLDDDVEFFDTRLAYLSVSRHGRAENAPWHYSYPLHWKGAWMLAQVTQQTHRVGLTDASLVIRSRPDIAFRDCFDLKRAEQVFTERRYLVIGQQLSADNFLLTNAATYRDQIAALLNPDDGHVCAPALLPPSCRSCDPSLPLATAQRRSPAAGWVGCVCGGAGAAGESNQRRGQRTAGSGQRLAARG
jgi:hypothetical protein